MTEVPPHGLEWTLRPVGRILALALALVSLLVSVYVGWRYVELVECLTAQDLADQRRTSAIAAATDVQNAADYALLKATGDDAVRLRQDAIVAREYVSRIRAANPAPPVQSCG